MEAGFTERIEKPWGYEILWTPKGLDRVGKVLAMKAGTKNSLQYHDQKEETQLLISGKALLWLEDEAGEMQKIEMEALVGYTVFPGKKHRLEALEDVILVEVSSPEKGTTYRLEDSYGRTDETEEVRKLPGRGWHQ